MKEELSEYRPEQANWPEYRGEVLVLGWEVGAITE